MRVTVTETTEHSADVTPEMVVEYLERNGFVKAPWSECAWKNDALPSHVVTVSSRIGKATVERIAMATGRKPHEVLYDIARMK